MSKNPARVRHEKLEWMNNHYIQSLDDDDLASRCLHFLSVAGLSPDLELLRRAMPLVKERMRRLSDSVSCSGSCSRTTSRPTRRPPR